MGGVADFVGDVVGGIGDVVEGAGNLVGDAVEFVGDTVGNTIEGVVNTTEAFLENPIEFTGNVIDNALKNPIETAAIVTASIYAPELISELAPELTASEAAVAGKAAVGATKAAISGGDPLTGALTGTVTGTLGQGIQSLGELTSDMSNAAIDEYLSSVEPGGYIDAEPDMSDFDIANQIESGVASLPVEESTVQDAGLSSLPAEPTDQQNLVTQTYDDGSQLTYDATTGLPVKGVDTEGAGFSVIDGVGSYDDTGAPLGGTPETNFGGELANPEDVQKLLDYNASVATPTTSTGGGGGGTKAATSGLTPAQMAAIAGIGALASKGLNMPNVPKLGYQGAPLQYTAERIPGRGVKYTPLSAAGGGLMNLYESNTPVAMYANGGATEAEALIANSQKAGMGQNVGIANQLNYLLGRGMSLDEAKQILQQGVNVYSFAHGGISDLGSYTHATGGRMLKGPGDGMSDSIPATIEGKRPARLATDEFVVPADVVSHLGNGSSDAGAKVLYEMMDKVRKARTGTKKQGKEINPRKYLPK